MGILSGAHFWVALPARVALCFLINRAGPSERREIWFCPP